MLNLIKVKDSGVPSKTMTLEIKALQTKSEASKSTMVEIDGLYVNGKRVPVGEIELNEFEADKWDVLRSKNVQGASIRWKGTVEGPVWIVFNQHEWCGRAMVTFGEASMKIDCFSKDYRKKNITLNAGEYIPGDVKELLKREKEIIRQRLNPKPLIAPKVKIKEEKEEYVQTEKGLAKVDKKSGFLLISNPSGKINLEAQVVFNAHRSGWTFAVKALLPLHNEKGIKFDGFLEDNFAWKLWTEEIRSPEQHKEWKEKGVFETWATSLERGLVPYRKPWIGMIHNPQNMPEWFDYRNSPQRIMAKKAWKDSMPQCKGLFALSEYHAQWLREQTGKPVSVLYHPTELPDEDGQFNLKRFLANKEKKVIQIGWWLRKLNSIYLLPLGKETGVTKIRLVPNFTAADGTIQDMVIKEREMYNLKLEEKYMANTIDVPHVTNEEYDKLLSENVAYVELYDSSANNAIIECMARTTPLLVNPLPPVVEYLGPEYPLYFSSHEEAAQKAQDIDLITKTHLYLKSWENRDKLSAEYFLKSFEQSDVYQSL